VPDHTGRRRRQSDLPLRRIAVLVVAIAAIGVLVWLPEPRRAQAPARPLAPAPARIGPESFATPGRLPDGTAYTPRLFLTAETSVGTAPSKDGASMRLVVRTGGRVAALRTIDAADEPQFAGFAVAGDTVVWAEAVSRDGAAARTTLWRANWRKSPVAVAITSATGEPSFYGGQFDTVIHGGRIYWASVLGGDGVTEVKSIPIPGGSVTTKRVTGDLALSAWPYAVSVDGGRGRPVLLVDYDTNARQTLATGPHETAACGSSWCRVVVFGDESLDRLEIVRPDGSERRQIAGGEATPTIVDVALLDRYVPLSTDRGDGAEPSGVGLSLYDITTSEIHLLAADVENVAGNGAMLWWSTGSGGEATWHAIDLRTLA
jgi:hypothetical protein